MMSSDGLVVRTYIRRIERADGDDVSNLMNPAVGVAFIGLSVRYAKFQMPSHRLDATRFRKETATIMKRLRGDTNQAVK